MNFTSAIQRWIRRDAATQTEVPAAPLDGVAELDAPRAADDLPVVWLLGKTGSGKSSIVSVLTGASHVEIGEGYVPCTRTAQTFDFPPEQPLIRYLDTRGLGEKGYDPTEDLQVNEARAHLVILTLRVRDDAQDALISAVHEIRRRHPNWPLIVAQTGLHDLYEGTADHPVRYPYSGNERDNALDTVPAPLRAALKNQRDRLARLPGPAPLFVPLDLTQPEDGYTPAAFGREALVEAIMRTAPEAAATIATLQMRQRTGAWHDISPQAHRLILTFAGGASGSGAIPIVGIGTVVAAQLGMVWALARQMEVPLERGHLFKLFAMLGAATLVRQGVMLGLRQIGKLVPFLIPVMALQDYAVTYALGRAANVYLRALQRDLAVDPTAVKEAFRRGLRQAFAFQSPNATTKGAATP